MVSSIAGKRSLYTLRRRVGMEKRFRCVTNELRVGADGSFWVG